GVQLEPIPTVHVSAPHTKLMSYGLLIGRDQRTTFITTDTQLCTDLLEPCYARADLIFHDCEVGPSKTGVHSHYDDLAQLHEAVRARMWLYDYQPGPLPDAA